MVAIEITFQHAPRELLQARELIPAPMRAASPCAPTSGVKREHTEPDSEAPSDFSDEEEAAAYAALVAKKAAKRARKAAAVKLESIELRPNFRKGEVIDLTLDDD